MCFHRRYLNVVYNAEAVDIEKRYSDAPVSDRGSDARFFMHPVVFDVEVTRRLPCIILLAFPQYSLSGYTLHCVVFRSFRIF